MGALTTRIISTNDPSALNLALETLRAGRLIVFPTDTLYGLGCDPDNPAALTAIYTAKNRPAMKALPVLIGEISQLHMFVESVPIQAARLIARYWPGPLTLVLPKNPLLPRELTPYPVLAVRMPDQSFARSLLVAAGALAVTSANISDRENPQNAEEVRAQLDGRVDLILDGGKLRGSAGSTIIDCLGSQPKLLREGPIPFQTLLDSWNAE